jgi:two-component system LytT family response regulator
MTGSQHIRAVLVDDEQLALRRLARLLEENGRVTIAGSFSDPVAAADFLDRDRVDVVFLDIEMPEMNGFELLARVAAPPPVIFTTAYDQYALRAFEVNSIDYLLKPIEARQLERAVAKLERLRTPSPQPDWRALAGWLAAAAPGFPRRITSRVGDRTHFIDLTHVTHFVAADKVTYAVSKARREIVDHTLAELEQKLDPAQFVRIHRAVLVNITFVEEIEQRAGGRAQVRLRDGNGTQLPLARDRLRALKERLTF